LDKINKDVEDSRAAYERDLERRKLRDKHRMEEAKK